MTAPEVRAGGEVRLAGRTLTGIAMPYRTVSPDYRERFEPGAFGNVGAIDVNLQHDPGVILTRGAALTDSPQALGVSATLAEASPLSAGGRWAASASNFTRGRSGARADSE